MSGQDTATLPATRLPRLGRVLDPLERSSEIMFGLIMALTFTSSVSVASSTRNDVATMLAAALSCNVAWGLVDAAMYVLAQMITRQRKGSFAIALADASPAEARQLLLERMPDGLEPHLSPEELDRLVKGLQSLPLASQNILPHREDIHGAAGIFLLVFLSTLPVALPFLFIGNVSTALRTSNAIAITLLFLVGTGLGRYMEWHSPWIAGLGIALFGAILVAITIALGG
jgi:VIT1/CCC1 family predicted Fe2+/Mn2+ transporter